MNVKRGGRRRGSPLMSMPVVLVVLVAAILATGISVVFIDVPYELKLAVFGVMLGAVIVLMVISFSELQRQKPAAKRMPRPVVQKKVPPAPAKKTVNRGTKRVPLLPKFLSFSFFSRRKTPRAVRTDSGTASLFRVRLPGLPGSFRSFVKKIHVPALSRKKPEDASSGEIEETPDTYPDFMLLPGKEAPDAEIWEQVIFREETPLRATPDPLQADETEVPPLPRLHDDDQNGVIERYWLVPGYAYARIVRDFLHGVKYEIIEPWITPNELVILEESHAYLKDVMIFDAPRQRGTLTLPYSRALPVIRTFDPAISDRRSRVLYYYLKRNFLGYGRLDPLMHDEELEDISCNGHDIPVFVFHKRYASMPTNLTYAPEEMNRFVQKLAQKADRQISLTSPLLDASLPEGSRVQLTYSDIVSPRGSSFTVRKFRSDPITPVSLVEFMTYSPEVLAFLWLAVENRKSLILVGGTASGKTSSMNAISFFIPANAKIVSLEDTREIQLPHANWLPTLTRENAAAATRADIDMFSLLRASLRQRPEFIIVGEVRGREAQTLFQAMNTGHTTFSTLHAGSIDEAVNRLINEPISVPPAMFGALDMMAIQSIHFRDGRIVRRCESLHELVVERGEAIGWRTIFTWNPHTDEFERTKEPSKVLAEVAYIHGWDNDELALQLSMRRDHLLALRKSGGQEPGELIQSFHDCTRRIALAIEEGRKRRGARPSLGRQDSRVDSRAG